MLSAANGSLITPAGQTAQPFNAVNKVYGADPAARMHSERPQQPLESRSLSGAISRYPRLPLGVTHAKAWSQTLCSALSCLRMADTSRRCFGCLHPPPSERGGAAARAARAINSTR
jgi:hypothetical protein